MNAGTVDQLLAAAGRASTGQPAQIAGGWSGAGIWRVELDDGPHALRVFDVRHERDVLPEASVLARAGDAGLPVARVAACGTAGDHAYQLLEWIDGTTMGESLLNGEVDARYAGTILGQLQARVHQVEAPPDLGHALDWPDPEVYPASLREILATVADRLDRLVHLDFHPANVLVAGGMTSGLIDWTNARRGDPRFDIARTYLILRLLPGVPECVRALYQANSRTFLTAWHRSYRGEMGAVRDFRPFLAWAGYGMLHDLGQKPEGQLLNLTTSLEFLTARTAGWMRSLAGD